MKEYWYLREGDFLPEPIDSICNSWYRSRRSMVKFLSKHANIFTSRDEAEEASRIVREVLFNHQLLRGLNAEINTANDIPPCDEG